MEFFSRIRAGSALLIGLHFVSTTVGQVSYVPSAQYRSTYYAAVDAYASRAFAHAEVVRARGEAAVNFAAARDIHAQAYAKELTNYVQEARSYWTRKAIVEAEIFKRKYNRTKALKRRNSEQWKRLQAHLTSPGKEVFNGNRLNELLQRMSGNVLAFSYSKDHYGDADDSPDLTLSSKVLHSLRLKQNRVGTNEAVFRADGGLAMELDWWPWILRDKQFESGRRWIETCRDQLTREVGEGKVSAKSLAAMEKGIVVLKRQLQLVWPKKQEFPEWARYNQSFDFLEALFGEIRAAQDSGSSLVFSGELKFDQDREGNDLISLLRFMRRHGLQFAAARPDDEPAYHQVYAMMLDLYANVADQDEGVKDDPTYRRPSPPEF